MAIHDWYETDWILAIFAALVLFVLVGLGYSVYTSSVYTSGQRQAAFMADCRADNNPQYACEAMWGMTRGSARR